MDCGSDHNALVAEVCLKLQKNINSKLKPVRWDSESTDQYSKQMAKALENMIMQHDKSESAEKLWKKFKEAMINSRKVLSHRDHPKKPWITNNTWELIRKRLNHKIKGIRDELQILEYNQLGRIINLALHKDKNDYIQSIYREIEQHVNNVEPKKLFKTISTLTRNFKPRHIPVKDENGLVLTTKPVIINRWKQYCEKLMASINARHRT